MCKLIIEFMRLHVDFTNIINDEFAKYNRYAREWHEIYFMRNRS